MVEVGDVYGVATSGRFRYSLVTASTRQAFTALRLEMLDLLVRILARMFSWIFEKTRRHEGILDRKKVLIGYQMFLQAIRPA